MLKDDLRVAAYGTVDEANAALGLARAELAREGGGAAAEELDTELAQLQSLLFDLGADLATPEDARQRGFIRPVDEHDVQAVEELPGVEAVATVVHDPFMVLLPGEVSGAGEKVVVARVSDSFFEINPKPIAYGRAPQNAGEVVLGPQAAEWAYPGLPPDEVIGRTVDLGRESLDGLSGIKTYTIAGVFRDGNWDSPGDLYDGIIVRFATAPLVAA